jgi:lysocardiolipin and lysophospholipid acyltransferase
MIYRNFLVNILAGQSAMINLSQFIGLLLYPFSKGLYQAYIEQTQRCFGVLLVAITQFFAPSTFVVTTDESAKGLVKKDWKNGRLFLDIPERIILTSNHQVCQGKWRV